MFIQYHTRTENDVEKNAYQFKGSNLRILFDFVQMKDPKKDMNAKPTPMPTLTFAKFYLKILYSFWLKIVKIFSR